MVALLLLALVLVLVFGSLGIFVAKVFLVGLLVALLIGAAAGYSSRRGTTA